MEKFRKIQPTPKHTVIEFKANKKITKEEIFKVMENAFDQSGCTACGLNGIDIHFYGPQLASNLTEGFNGFDSSRIRENMEFDRNSFDPSDINRG